MRGDAGFVDRTAGRVLADPAATPVVVGYAGWAAAIAGGFQAWDDVAAARFRRGVEACGRSADTAALGLNLRYWEVTGLALAGEVATGRARAEAAAADTWSPAARHMVAMLRVPVELAAGRVRTVARICRDALLDLPGPRGGWVELMQLLLGTACGCAGDAAGSGRGAGGAGRLPLAGTSGRSSPRSRSPTRGRRPRRERSPRPSRGPVSPGTRPPPPSMGGGVGRAARGGLFRRR